ncbi:MAG: efflux RND transporter periplasmic adaptor subunit [Candidatus Sumerlaeia bacterium]|nr:efflux RND transporter periplasmic adaptor subunit [Candidatus Sumerlaeia bacterium]
MHAPAQNISIDRQKIEGLRIDERRKRGGFRPVLMAVPVILLAIGGLAFFASTLGDGGVQRFDTAGYQETSTAPAPPRLAALQESGTQAPAVPGEELFRTSGYIVPRERIELSPRFQATVEEILVGKGDKVAAGQVLVRLEDDEYAARLAQAQAEAGLAEAQLEEFRNGTRPEEVERARFRVSDAEAQLVNAEATLSRRRSLFSVNSASQESLDEAVRARASAEAQLNIARQELALAELGPRREQVAQAEARLASAKASVAGARVYVDWCTIAAPIEGTILTREVDAGELVVPQSFGGSGGPSTSFLSMADLTDLQVQVDLNEQFTAQVFLDQLCEVSPLAAPERKFTGYVFEIAPEANRAKGTLEVKVQIIDPDASLTPELSAQVSFRNGKYDGAAGDRTKRTRRTQ